MIAFFGALRDVSVSGAASDHASHREAESRQYKNRRGRLGSQHGYDVEVVRSEVAALS